MSLTSTCGLPEVAVAAEYWANLIDSDGLSAPQLMMFKESLMRGMIGKFNGHWFPQNRERGSAFRYVEVTVTISHNRVLVLILVLSALRKY